MNVNTTLIQEGYLFDRSCGCGGTKNEVYKKGHKEIWVRPNRFDILVKSYSKVKKVFKNEQVSEAIQYAEKIH